MKERDIAFHALIITPEAICDIYTKYSRETYSPEETDDRIQYQRYLRPITLIKYGEKDPGCENNFDDKSPCERLDYNKWEEE